MWFRKESQIEKLKGLKRIKVNGMNFTIRKINPILDFHSDRIPQIFTDHTSVKVPLITPDTIKKNLLEMQEVVRVGVVKPEVRPNGTKGDVFTPEDFFRDPTMGIKLYHEILNHSLNRFRGLSKLFFWIGIKLSLLMWFANGTVKDLQTTSSGTGNLA